MPHAQPFQIKPSPKGINNGLEERRERKKETQTDGVPCLTCSHQMCVKEVMKKKVETKGKEKKINYCTSDFLVSSSEDGSTTSLCSSGGGYTHTTPFTTTLVQPAARRADNSELVRRSIGVVPNLRPSMSTPVFEVHKKSLYKILQVGLD